MEGGGDTGEGTRRVKQRVEKLRRNGDGERIFLSGGGLVAVVVVVVVVVRNERPRERDGNGEKEKSP